MSFFRRVLQGRTSYEAAGRDSRSEPLTDLDSDLDTIETARQTDRALSRRHYSMNSHMTDIETSLGAAQAPFEKLDRSSDQCPIATSTIDDLRSGCSFQDLVDNHPEDVLTVLNDFAVARQGAFRVKDSDALRAFGVETMLTRDSDAPDDPFWEQNWREVIAQRAKQSNTNLMVGWEEMVTIGAYVVHLKHLANRDHGDIIQLLMQKSASKAAPKAVWGFDSVRAVINFHWQHWVRRILLSSFILFIIWSLLFATYSIFYIETAELPSCPLDSTPAPAPSMTPDNVMQEANDQGELVINSPHLRKKPIPKATEPESFKCSTHACACPDDEKVTLTHYGSFSNGGKSSFWIRLLSILCFVVMCPFSIEEYYTIITQRLDWISPMNVVEFSTHSIQLFIFVCHLTNFGLKEEWFGIVIAIQAALLSVRLLRYFRLLGEGTTFLDTALAVIFDMRYWFGYIIVTGIAATFCFGALYRREENFNGVTAAMSERDVFNGTQNTMVSTFQIIFSSFDVAYIFKADKTYMLPKIVFFFAFQIIMNVTVLNLIIAAMSESYSTRIADKINRLYRGRAQVIHETFGLRLPKFMMVQPKAYIHFIVVEKKSLGTTANVAEAKDPMEEQKQQINELKKDVKEALIDALRISREEQAYVSANEAPPTEL